MLALTGCSEYLARRAVPALALSAAARPSEAEILEAPSRAEAFEGAGHFLHQEKPERFDRLLLDWVDRLPAETGPPPRADRPIAFVRASWFTSVPSR